jgi:hypothetical protein
MFDKGYAGEKLCLVSTDMVDLMTDEVDKAGTKVLIHNLRQFFLVAIQKRLDLQN